MQTNQIAGLDATQREQIVSSLSQVLADAYTLYLKTQKFHWNVTGPYFHSLHTLFENQYTDLAVAVDDIAECIRALGFFAPGSYTEFMQLATIQESLGELKAMDMIKELVTDHELMVLSLHKAFPFANSIGEQATVDLLTQRIRAHEKMGWMLRSVLA